MSNDGNIHELIDKLNGARVLCIGDVMLDKLIVRAEQYNNSLIDKKFTILINNYGK